MRDSDVGRRQELAIEIATLKATNLELEQQVAQWKASYYPLKEDFEGLRKKAAGTETENIALKAQVEKCERALDVAIKALVAAQGSLDWYARQTTRPLFGAVETDARIVDALILAHQAREE